MRSVQYFDAASGLWTGVQFSGGEDDVAANAPAGATAMDAVEFPHAMRLVDGALVDYQPPPPDGEHEWDAAQRRWRMTEAAASRRRARREAQDQIDALEASQPRILRERELGDMTIAEARQRLRAINDEIAALRAIINS